MRRFALRRESVEIEEGLTQPATALAAM